MVVQVVPRVLTSHFHGLHKHTHTHSTRTRGKLQQQLRLLLLQLLQTNKESILQTVAESCLQEWCPQGATQMWAPHGRARPFSGISIFSYQYIAYQYFCCLLCPFLCWHFIVDLLRYCSSMRTDRSVRSIRFDFRVIFHNWRVIFSSWFMIVDDLRRAQRVKDNISPPANTTAEHVLRCQEPPEMSRKTRSTTTHFSWDFV